MRILAIDYGKKRCGIAISDREKKIAIPYGIVKSENLLEEIKKIVKEKNVGEILIGLPLSLSGKEIELTKEVYKLKSEIEKELNIQVTLLDERMTSKLYNKSENIDDLSAAILLEDYLKMSL